jgi:acetylornithine/succinyldiaminopimelate/putrescine aminotransferase
MGRTGHYFAVDAYVIEPDVLTSAKSLGGGVPCGAVMTSECLSSLMGTGDLGSTFGGGPIAAAAILAVIETIESEGLLRNVREREAQIRDLCSTGPVQRIQGMGMLLGLVCDRPAKDVQSALLRHDILTGTSADNDVLRLLPPLVLQPKHVEHLAEALARIAPAT